MPDTRSDGGSEKMTFPIKKFMKYFFFLRICAARIEGTRRPSNMTMSAGINELANRKVYLEMFPCYTWVTCLRCAHWHCDFKFLAHLPISYHSLISHVIVGADNLSWPSPRIFAGRPVEWAVAAQPCSPSEGRGRSFAGGAQAA